MRLRYTTRMRMQPYIQLMRADKPAGTWLTFWPAAWAIAMASPKLPHQDSALYGLFLLGAFCMRSAGCIMNDIADRRIDAQVARTKDRPLAARTMPLWHALLLLALLLCGAWWVARSLPHDVMWLAYVALPLVACYPLMKRITFWPQAFLGITFNLSALFGWLAASGELALGAMWLYVAALFWTLGYDTLYAMQDREDDARIGMKSTARVLGGFSVAFAFVCYAHTFFLISWAGYAAGYAIAFALGMVGVLAHMGWQWRLLHTQPDQEGRVFRSNAVLGALVWLAIAMARYV
jgi:4-hydroxybenzoate polyprenyltransferase